MFLIPKRIYLFTVKPDAVIPRAQICFCVKKPLKSSFTKNFCMKNDVQVYSMHLNPHYENYKERDLGTTVVRTPV